jgi:hypothetical protein
MGGYYYSGTDPRPAPAMATVTGPAAGICSAPSNSVPVPDFGFAKVCGRLIKDRGDTIVPVSGFMANVTNDPNVLRQAKPYRMEIILKLAEDVSVPGVRLEGVCKVNQNGAIYSYPMASTLSTDGHNGYVAIRSDPIIPVEPYAWTSHQQTPPSPYWLDERLIVPVKLSSMGYPATTVTYEVTGIEESEALKLLSAYWLTSNKTLDINHDGIVNFKDVEDLN